MYRVICKIDGDHTQKMPTIMEILIIIAEHKKVTAEIRLENNKCSDRVTTEKLTE